MKGRRREEEKVMKEEWEHEKNGKIKGEREITMEEERGKAGEL